MRKSLVWRGKCECGHSPSQHKDDGDFFVECNVKGCDCEEYDEPHENIDGEMD